MGAVGLRGEHEDKCGCFSVAAVGGVWGAKFGHHRLTPSLLQAGLPGFYDPCVGEEKNLKVLYQFRGVLHQVMALDNEALRIPKQCECPGWGQGLRPLRWPPWVLSPCPRAGLALSLLTAPLLSPPQLTGSTRTDKPPRCQS